MSSTRNLVANTLSTKDLVTYTTAIPVTSSLETATYSSSLWQRPADWLSMPSVNPPEQKFVGLHAIYPGINHIALYLGDTFNRPFGINWGDGTIVSASSSTTIYKSYNFADIPDATLTSEGFKQVVVTATPLPGTFMTNVLFPVHPSGSSRTGWLDVIVSAPSHSAVWGPFNSWPGGIIQRYILTGSNPITSPNQNNVPTLQYLYLDIRNVTSMNSIFGTINGNMGLLEADIVIGNPTSLASMFSNCGRLKRVNFLSGSTRLVTDFSSLFNGCYNLSNIPEMDTSNGTTFANMFQNCFSLTSVPSTLNTSRGTNFSSMFNGCRQLKTIPILNTISGSNFSSMFNGCHNLRYVPPLDTRNATSVNSMFANCTALETVPNLNLGKVTDAFSLFQNCHSLIKPPEVLNFQSHSGQLTDIFSACYSLKKAPRVIFPTKATQSGFFNSCYSLDDISDLDTTNVVIFNSMFANCYSLKSIKNLNLTSGSTFSSMFTSCRSLIDVPLTMSLPNATDLGSMFNQSGLINAPLFTDLQKVTTVASMFSQAEVKHMQPILGLISCSNFSSMFSSCPRLSVAPYIETSNARNVTSMFQSCTTLQKVPQYNLEKIETASSMFSSCTNLYSFPTFSGATLRTASAMFQSCQNIRYVPPLTASQGLLTTNMFDGCSGLFSGGIVSGARFAISYANASLSSASIIDIFNNLGTAAGSQIINITGNVGAAGLSAGDRAIATGKGWTISG